MLSITGISSISCGFECKFRILALSETPLHVSTISLRFIGSMRFSLLAVEADVLSSVLDDDVAVEFVADDDVDVEAADTEACIKW